MEYFPRLYSLWLYQYYAVAILTRYAVSRYTLFLALVDFHAFKRAAPAWDLPGTLQQPPNPNPNPNPNLNPNPNPDPDPNPNPDP